MSDTVLPRLAVTPGVDGRPASPCIRNCCLDDDDVCHGCGRRLDEILAWHSADDDGRQAILVLAAGRREARVLRRRAAAG
jgi:predicted Fe-S protein YdhL (DUF1289 family)